ncbi:acetate--CoA ligase [Candidatus Woesearchaeota archaeon]|nr:acetate--CoA ligase [Candidatus Woesearchaeota archaeon]
MANKPKIIKKNLRSMAVKPNLLDYQKACRTFSYRSVEKELHWFSKGKLNAGYNAIDRHVDTWRKNKVALYWIGDTEEKKYTFLEMSQLSNQFANALVKQGVKKGDRVFIFLERIPELYISFISVLKTGAIAGTLFAAFQKEALLDRLRDSGASIIITSPTLKPRIDDIKKSLPDLKAVIVTGEFNPGKGELSYNELVKGQSTKFRTREMAPKDKAYMLYTSGTTGKPKGVVHTHYDIVHQYMTSKWVLDIQDSDVYWCTADPGWVTGIAYGILGPWFLGASSVVDARRFSAENWYSIIDRYKVTVWYTAPTAIRMMMKEGKDLAKKYDLSSLRHMCSVGEPLNPEAIYWGMETTGLVFHDNWWQTETGGILIANYPGMAVKPGSMGKPFPGIKAAIVDEKGKVKPAGKEGNLALKPGWPSMMIEIWKNPVKYKEYFRDGWYISGDKARMDKDGYFWFIGRADDVIKTAGHRVGPFEVESALVAHPAVAEAGVIGKPHEVYGEIIKAFVSLKKGYKPSEELKQDIQKFIKGYLAGHAYPKEIEFRDNLPKTRSGKIMRRVLKCQELGLPVGDTSTLED